MTKLLYPDEFLGYLQLREDLLFDRIPIEDRMNYVKRSLEIGRKDAARTPQIDLFDLFAAAGVVLEEKAQSGSLITTKLRAQYEVDKNGRAKVTYYRESITNLAEAAGISFEQALNIHLAHEYFHLLELKEKPVNERLPKVTLPSIFGWKRTATVIRISEIAANAFAKSFLKLAVLPNYYDYLYLERIGEISQAWLEQTYNQFLEVNGV